MSCSAWSRRGRLPRLYRHSEIRLVRTRDFGVLSGVVFMRVFGADNLLPLCYERAPIRFGRRPGHRENAFILDRKMKLKPLALVVGVRCPATSGSLILYSAAILRYFGSFLINQP